MNLERLVRPNIWKLKPYSSARDEFHGTASVFLDANENPYNAPFNRYPDPMQWELKTRIAALKGVEKESIFLGNGSDEPIDLLIRAFCNPGEDNIISIAPSYGMYEVAANINHVTFKTVTLNTDFELEAGKLLSEVDVRTKLIFLCSPNNPTGNSLKREKILKIINKFNGIVVVDEAYIDFANEPSFLSELQNHPNLVVLQTLSKAWGAAAIRLGMAFASPEIIAILNKIKYPYNVNLLTQQKALELLNNEAEKQKQVEIILAERSRLQENLSALSFVKQIYPSDANFLLVKVEDANGLYNYLVEQEIIVRNRNNVVLCSDCLRITVGTPQENDTLLKALKSKEA